MFRLLILMLILTPQLSAKKFSEQYLHIEPITWEELQVFQSDNLKSAESLNLSDNCPTDLNGIKSLEQGGTAFKELLWSHYYWTEFKNTDGLNCLVKHVGFKFNPNQKFGPFFYEILTTQQARILLSAAQSIGFRKKGLGVVRHHVGKHNGAISDKPYKKYGGLNNIVEFKRNNKPENLINYTKDKVSYEKYKEMSYLEVFESYYTEATLYKLIEKAQAEAEKNPPDQRYPFQSKAELRRAIKDDLTLLNKDNKQRIANSLEFLMPRIKPQPKIVWD